jgi:hypothetical protein
MGLASGLESPFWARCYVPTRNCQMAGLGETRTPKSRPCRPRETKPPATRFAWPAHSGGGAPPSSQISAAAQAIALRRLHPFPPFRRMSSTLGFLGTHCRAGASFRVELQKKKQRVSEDTSHPDSNSLPCCGICPGCGICPWCGCPPGPPYCAPCCLRPPPACC